jgi:hypothetical protein
MLNYASWNDESSWRRRVQRGRASECASAITSFRQLILLSAGLKQAQRRYLQKNWNGALISSVHDFFARSSGDADIEKRMHREDVPVIAAFRDGSWALPELRKRPNMVPCGLEPAAVTDVI